MSLFRWFSRFSRRDTTLCCQDIEELSSGYVDEDLSPSIAAQFKAHMGACPDCNTFYATFRATVLTLRNFPKRPAPPDLKDRIQARIAAESRGGQPDPTT